MDGDGPAAELLEERVQVVSQESTKLSPVSVHLGANRGRACASQPGQSVGTLGVAGRPEDQSASWGKWSGRGSLGSAWMDSTREVLREFCLESRRTRTLAGKNDGEPCCGWSGKHAGDSRAAILTFILTLPSRTCGRIASR